MYQFFCSQASLLSGVLICCPALLELPCQVSHRPHGERQMNWVSPWNRNPYSRWNFSCMSLNLLLPRSSSFYCISGLVAQARNLDLSLFTHTLQPSHRQSHYMCLQNTWLLISSMLPASLDHHHPSPGSLQYPLLCCHPCLSLPPRLRPTPRWFSGVTPQRLSTTMFCLCLKPSYGPHPTLSKSQSLQCLQSPMWYLPATSILSSPFPFSSSVILCLFL